MLKMFISQRAIENFSVLLRNSLRIFFSPLFFSLPFFSFSFFALSFGRGQTLVIYVGPAMIDTSRLRCRHPMT